MKIMVLGIRGMPGVQGGVETHAEHLYPIIAAQGGDVVEVLVRKPYQPAAQACVWQGITLTPLWSPTTRGVETLVHSILGVFYAAIKRPDILHIHAIGPSIVAPLARLFGLHVVVTHHGPDYDRQKWGGFAKAFLRLSEYLGMRFANKRIVISKVIRRLVKQKYGLDSELIPNGVVIHNIPDTITALTEFGLTANHYILQVSRFVPEKRQLDLITAFEKAKLSGWKLVLVGEVDRDDTYTRKIIERVEQIPNVTLTGFQTGQSLEELYAHAGLFVLPSSHEGLPIALLEAMSYGLYVLASAIPANLEVGLSDDQYFPLGDTNELAKHLLEIDQGPTVTHDPVRVRDWVRKEYNWNIIAEQTIDVYQSILYERG